MTPFTKNTMIWMMTGGIVTNKKEYDMEWRKPIEISDEHGTIISIGDEYCNGIKTGESAITIGNDFFAMIDTLDIPAFIKDIKALHSKYAKTDKHVR